ncbi:hypothetical protein J2X31_002190 [Flavobacterium arsenatis]|uniref:Uncharacterized protein n=1 Tax=Flavobacterium arsenatis TaxID=1484332 RepID=A0ABU1TQD4_9FLAO|nr:hypothetical protein [Flavobacterium arsenatis]MDR6968175.1 hypothetical protein [Flavobacterium arsenatis]
MSEKPQEYKEFIDRLCKTGDIEEYSKADLEDYKSTIELCKSEDNDELANLYKALGPLFSKLTKVEKQAFGKWNEYLVRYGIANCLQQLEFNKEIHLAIDEKIPKFDYAKDFWDRCKTDGSPYGNWEIK